MQGGRYAAFTLSNLAVNKNHRQQLVTEGVVPPLVALACSEEVNAQRQALYALRGPLTHYATFHSSVLLRLLISYHLLCIAKTDTLSSYRAWSSLKHLSLSSLALTLNLGSDY